MQTFSGSCFVTDVQVGLFVVSLVYLLPFCLFVCMFVCVFVFVCVFDYLCFLI